jgi:hypothetical protein
MPEAERSSSQSGPSDEAASDQIESPPEIEAVIEDVVSRALVHYGATPEQILLKQIKSSHITQLLENQAREIEFQHELEKARHQFIPTVTFVIIIASLLGIFALSWLFLAYSRADTLIQVLVPILTFISGLAGGYGLGRTTAERKQQP